MDTDIYLSQEGFAVATDAGETQLSPLISESSGCFGRRRSAAGHGPSTALAILLPLAFALHLPQRVALILLATVYVAVSMAAGSCHSMCSSVGDAAAIMSGAGRLPMAQRERRRGAVDFRSQLIFGSLIAIGGIILFAWRNGHILRSGGIFRLNGFTAIRLSWQHDGANRHHFWQR